MRTLAVSLALVLASTACSKNTPSSSEAHASPPLAKAPAPSAAVADPEPVVAPEPEPEPVAEPEPPPRRLKKYARVLHTGDSMVGGGLTLALGPKFRAEGAKYFQDVNQSGTIHEFSQSDRLPELLKRTRPDLVILTLGANHVGLTRDLDRSLGRFVSRLVKRFSGTDCYWIAPPIWKPEQAAFNAWLKDQVAPCKFYDGSHLEIARRADKIHPNDKGGEVWAEDFWAFFKGDGAFLEPEEAPPDAGAAP